MNAFDRHLSAPENGTPAGAVEDGNAFDRHMNSGNAFDRHAPDQVTEPGMFRQAFNFLEDLAANPEDRLPSARETDFFTDPTASGIDDATQADRLSKLNELIVKPTVGALETAGSLATGLTAYPLSIAAQTAGMALRKPRHEIDQAMEEVNRYFTYEPRTEAAQKPTELIGKGFEHLMWGANKADELLQEAGYPNAGLAARFGLEMLTFKGLHTGAAKIKSKLKSTGRPQVSAADRAQETARNYRMMEKILNEAGIETGLMRDQFQKQFNLDPFTMKKPELKPADKPPTQSRGEKVWQDFFDRKNPPPTAGPGAVNLGARRAAPSAEMTDLGGTSAPAGPGKIKRGPKFTKSRKREPVLWSANKAPIKYTGKGEPKTLGQFIEDRGGINPLNFQTEAITSWPANVKRRLAHPDGMPFDELQRAAQDAGFLGETETIMDVLMEPEAMRRGKFGDIQDRAHSQMTNAERRFKQEMEQGPEGPPEGEYKTVRADELELGEEYTVLEGGGAAGYDHYKVIEKDPFETILKDGETIALPSTKKIDVLKSDLKKPPPTEVREEQLGLFGEEEYFRDPYLKPKDRQRSLFDPDEPAAAPKAPRKQAEKKAPPPLEGQGSLFDIPEQKAYRKTLKGDKDVATNKALDFKDPKPAKVNQGRKTAERVGFETTTDAPIRMQTTGHVRAKGFKVHNAQDAAGLLAQIRKYPQEEFYVVVTDSKGRLLEIEKHTKGRQAASQVDAAQVAGRVFNTPGAEKVYTVHNHPSGGGKFSTDDLVISDMIEALLNIKNIEHEAVVIAGKKYGRYNASAYIEDRPIKPTSRLESVPVRERRFTRPPRQGRKILTDDDAWSYLKDHNLLDTEGAILTDASGKVVGTWKYEPGQPTRDVASSLIAAAESHNTTRILPFFEDSINLFDREPLKAMLWDVRDATRLDIPDIIYSNSDAVATSLIGSNQQPRPKKNAPVKMAQDLATDTTLYSGVPIHKFTGHKWWEKNIGKPIWNKVIMGMVPNALERIPVVGKGMSAIRRALDVDYTGNLPKGKDYVALRDDARRGRQIGADYGINLGNRLGQVPQESRIKIGQAITGQDVKLNPIENKLASEASWALLELGKQATTLGLLSEEVFFKNAGRYMPRLYTSREYSANLNRWGLKRPERIDMSRFQKRKDIPVKIRKEMGEILTPGYPVAKGIVQLTHTIETAEWLRHISQNPEWTAGGKVPTGMVKSVRERIAQLKTERPDARLNEILTRANEDFPDLNLLAKKQQGKDGQWSTKTIIEKAGEIPEGWVKLPDTPGLGDLRGAHVHPEIARDVNWTLKIPSAMERLNQKWLSRWKSGKVVWSWKTHVRNNLSNALLSHLGGMPLYVQPKYLTQAAREIHGAGKYWREAKREGLMSSTFVHSELRSMFDQVSRQMNGVREGSLESTLGNIGDVTARIRSAGKKLGDAYQWEEQWHKLGKYIHNRTKRNMTAREAAADANKWLFDYGRVTRSQEGYRRSFFGAPFATFTFKAIPRVLEAAVVTPHRYLLPAALIWGLEEWSRKEYQDDPIRSQAKHDARPEWMQGNFLGIPNFVQTPLTDDGGREHWLNLSYILPWGDLAGESGSMLPGVPSGLMPISHPLTKEAVQQASNYDWFWKDPIVDSSEIAGKPPLEKLYTAGTERLKHAGQAFAPTPVMDASKIYSMMKGDPDYRGRERMPGVVLADILGGLKMYPVDYVDEMVRQIGKIHPKKSGDARKIMAKIKTAAVKKKAMDKKGKSTELYDKMITGYIEQLKGLSGETAGKARIKKKLKK